MNHYQKNIDIACLVPKSDDPTSFYRAFGPIGELRKLMPLRLNLPSVYNWATMGISDIIFMQRPVDPQCLSIANQAKMSRVPLWVDFDDDNLSVPMSNESIHVFGRHDVKDMIVKVSRLADVITVSTEQLKKKYSVYNKNIVVIPNSINDKYLHFRNVIPKRPRDRVIIWRGGPGFMENIAEIAPSIVKVGQANPSWKFIFMGHNPWQITTKLKNSIFVDWIENYLDYLVSICQMHASAFIYCLADNDHSRSRSNIVWQEATFAGSICLAKNLPEFQKAKGCLTFNDAAEFEEKLQGIIDKKIDVEAAYQESWAHIEENYMLSKNNLKRIHVIGNLLGLQMVEKELPAA